MGQLAEIVFSGFEPQRLKALLSAFRHLDAEDLALIQAFTDGDGERSVTLPVRDGAAGTIPLPELSVRLLQYDGMAEANLLWEIGGMLGDDVQRMFRELHDFCSRIARREEVSRFAGGIEPADDPNTRFF